MPISIDDKMKREIIIDHYNSPVYKKTPTNVEDFLQIHMDSVSCIDNIYIYLKIENNIIKEAYFDGVACAISTASTDILCGLILNKSKEEALYILEQYQNMIFEKEYDESVLEEAVVFSNTYKQAARIKCATIGCNGMKEIIDGKK